MPTYDYKCNACSHAFEHFQSMKDKPLRKCPSCGKNTLERLIGTGAAVIFKGSGFYQTDYRSEGYRKAADADKPAETVKADAQSGANKDDKAGTKADVKADPKPAEKPANNTAAHGKETIKAPADAKKKPGKAAKR